MGIAPTDPGVFLDRLGVSAFGGVENMSGTAMAAVFEAAMSGHCAADDFVCKVVFLQMSGIRSPNCSFLRSHAHTLCMHCSCSLVKAQILFRYLCLPPYLQLQVLIPELLTFHVSSRSEGSLTEAARTMQKLHWVSQSYFSVDS